MPTETDYKMVSRRELNQILDSPGETYEPRGLFLCWDLVDDKDVWTAVNNIQGDAITEEFIDKRSAVRWLHGHAVAEKQKYRGKSKTEIETERRIARLRMLSGKE